MNGSKIYPVNCWQEKQISNAQPESLRIVLLADDEVLHIYGPVLRRLAVGLIDETADITLLCRGTSHLLDHVPSPPVRLITKTTSYYETTPRIETGDRIISMISPKASLLDSLWPHRRLLRTAEVLSQYKPTLLHALSEKMATMARRLSKQLSIPYVVSILSHDLDGLILSDNNCGQILPCFSSLARQIRRRHPQMSSRVHLLPVGTHVRGKPCCFDHDQRRPQLFCSGPFDNEHGVGDLINAAKRLSLMGHKFHLTLSGRGPAQHELRQQVKQLGIVNRVHFIDPLEYMIADNDAYRQVLQAVDIFIQPWPSKVWRPELLEAMSVGNAVVVADATDNDLILKNKTAATTAFQNEQALSDTLNQLLTDQNYSRALAKRGQDYVRKHFLASDMITRLEHAYRKAVQIKNIS